MTHMSDRRSVFITSLSLALGTLTFSGCNREQPAEPAPMPQPAPATQVAAEPARYSPSEFLQKAKQGEQATIIGIAVRERDFYYDGKPELWSKFPIRTSDGETCVAVRSRLLSPVPAGAVEATGKVWIDGNGNPNLDVESFKSAEGSVAIESLTVPASAICRPTKARDEITVARAYYGMEQLLGSRIVVTGHLKQEGRVGRSFFYSMTEDVPQGNVTIKVESGTELPAATAARVEGVMGKDSVTGGPMLNANLGGVEFDYSRESDRFKRGDLETQ